MKTCFIFLNTVIYSQYCPLLLLIKSPPSLSILFYYLLYILVNNKRKNLENIDNLKEILCESCQRIWKIIEIFTAPKESVFSPRFNKGMDTSPVCSLCSGRTGFAIFSVFRTVKLLLMNLAKFVCCSGPDTFLFSLTLFFHQFGLCSICRECMFQILNCCVFAYKSCKGKEIPDCVYKHQNLIICRILILISHHPQWKALQEYSNSYSEWCVSLQSSCRILIPTRRKSVYWTE